MSTGVNYHPLGARIGTRVWLHSRHSRVLIGPPSVMDSLIAFALVRPLVINPVPDEHSHSDVYLDDVLSVFPGLSDAHSLCGIAAVLLAIEVIGRLLAEHEPMLHDELLHDELSAIKKVLVEGTPTKILMVLGWLIDTCALTIGLTKDKFVAWLADITRILHKCTCGHHVSYDDLKMLVGCLQHVANVLVLARHFLSYL